MIPLVYLENFMPILHVAERHVPISMFVVEEHDVGIDDINETPGIHHLIGEFSGEFLIGKTDLSICQKMSYLHILFTRCADICV